MAAYLEEDLVVDEEKFNSAAQQMEALKKRTNDLKTKLDKMYEDLASAMDTAAGKEVQLEAKKVLLKPVENMSLVVGHISDTLNLIIGSGYYKDVFTGFEELSHLF
ncbi:MAG: hypothetical protein IJJ76_06115 [Ruminococcus sp.]|jgi:hypothetical protein|uniref:hypothetical protein n=1 Tax=Ruminococcus sp. TaxID=41978 RepID=UPI0025D805DD|nr:hypothetical protein [Ruminococcus sp.]MBQ9542771.1 hypothetical protein [Ruminococcus sp.]MBR0529329.1 hypothetical protein [Ruminococcus sp.]